LVINPLVLQHAEDAAFYWTQRSTKAHSPLLRFDRLTHFDRQLTAHLDGLRVAGDVGWECALKNLQRWKHAGEAFTAYVLAIESGDKMRLQTLWSVVEKNAETMQDGLISALAWVAEETAVPWMDFWLPLANYPRLQQIALHAFALRRLEPDVPLDDFFASPDATVREAVCTLAGRLRLSRYVSLLQTARKDAAPEVREAATVALLLLGHGVNSLSDLWQASLHWNEMAANSKGWTKSMAIRRAEAAARHIGHALPVAHEGMRQLMERIPARQGLIVLAHHGDPATVQWIIGAMSRKDLARVAGWAFTMVVGADLDALRLTAAAPEPDANEDERRTPLQDPDIGLSWPHAAAVDAWWSKNGGTFTAGTRLLHGHLVADRNHNIDLLLNAPQATRWAAAFNLALNDTPYFETNAAASEQRAALDSLIGDN
jgi:uncharacterized protein (TIGR02270 family)